LPHWRPTGRDSPSGRAAALEAYRSGLAIRKGLADADNAGLQRDLAISHGLEGTTLARQNVRDRAAASLSAGRAIIAKLKERSPNDATLPEDLAWFDAQLAVLRE
jgi:hypothetical protein